LTGLLISKFQVWSDDYASSGLATQLTSVCHSSCAR